MVWAAEIVNCFSRKAFAVTIFNLVDRFKCILTLYKINCRNANYYRNELVDMFGGRNRKWRGGVEASSKRRARPSDDLSLFGLCQAVVPEVMGL